MDQSKTMEEEIYDIVSKISNFDQLPYQQQEWIKCKASFEYFACTYLDILNPADGLVKFKLYEYQRRCIRDFNNYKFNIVSKFRQGGLTTLAVLWSLWKCMFVKDQSILLLSRTDSDAVISGDIARKALQNMKFKNAWMCPELAEESKHTLWFSHTGSTMAFHSPERARGKTATLIIIDEAAFIDNMEDHWRSMYPVVSAGGNVIVISTVNGRGNWYEKQYTDALNNKNKFHVIDLDYTEHPKYSDPEWVKTTKANMDEKSFAQEYLRSFLGSGNTFIKSDILAELAKSTNDINPVRKLYPDWDTDKVLSEEDWEKEDLVAFNRGALHVFKEPQDGREYIMGCDVAEGIGDEGDNSTFQVIDVNSLEQVAEFASNKVPIDVFAQIISVVGEYYNTALVVVERNTGYGAAILDKLDNSIYYENVYHSQIRSSEKSGLIISKTNRLMLMEALQNYLHNKYVKIKSKRLVRELDTFIFNRNTKKAEAMKGYHDDLIMALSITLYVRDQTIREVPLGVKLPDNIINSTNNNPLFDSLKKEIERGLPEEYFLIDEKEDLAPMPELYFDIKRKFDGLLKEFGF